MVIGAGLAGLSAAVHLAAAGRDVVVVEAGAGPGGCCGSATVGGYRFDTGPTVLTMPEILRETVGAAGEELDRWLPLVRLDPTYRMTFPDGSRLDVVPGAEPMTERVRALAGAAEAARYAAFRTHLAAMSAAAWDAFVAAAPPAPRELLRAAMLARLVRIARLGGLRRLDRLVAAHLTDWRLRRAHTFQALYIGVSPHTALGVYALIAAMDTIGGAYFPRSGGMYAVPQALAGVAEKAGARLRYGTRAVAVEAGADGVRAVRLDSGERLAASAVVVTGDLPQAYAHLLPAAARRERPRRPGYAPSCLVVHLGIPRRLPDQAHHTVHFGTAWRDTFTALTRRGRPQPGPDPSLLVTYPERDRAAAPPGHATLTVLEPTANLCGRTDWSRETRGLRARLFATLAGLGYGDLAAEAAAELVVDPPRWRAWGHPAGTPFGLDHRIRQTAWLRPRMVSRAVPGLVFAGACTVPGVGVPPVLISGRLAAEAILAGRR